MNAMLDAAHAAGLDIGTDPTPADVAVRLRRCKPELLEQIHADQCLLRYLNRVQIENRKFVGPAAPNVSVARVMLRVELEKWQQTTDTLRCLARDSEHRRTRERFFALYQVVTGSRSAMSWAAETGRLHSTVLEWKKVLARTKPAPRKATLATTRATRARERHPLHGGHRAHRTKAASLPMQRRELVNSRPGPWRASSGQAVLPAAARTRKPQRELLRRLRSTRALLYLAVER